MTERVSDVRLRGYGSGDLDLLRSLLGDARMMRFLGGAETEQALLERHERYLKADPKTHGLFTIVTGEGDMPVGWVGFWEDEWDGETVWECGWHVLPSWQRRGIASAAAVLSLDEARARHLHRFVDAHPSVDNVASNAVCRALGFANMGEVEVEFPKGHEMAAVHWRFDLQDQ